MKIYNEVKITHHIDGFWVVDAWKTTDLNEEGKVIALINDVTGDMYPIGQLDELAKGVIDIKQSEIVGQTPETLATLYGELGYADRDIFLSLMENL